ncbi:MAG TPA: heavy metal translocating P-type ATPase [Armatimonadota bacterium]|nr:heavy metal translocating P-type ATPase [Armatimonadota bacterium]
MAIGAELTCDLCSLPTPGRVFERIIDGEPRRFCCSGCLNVYTILNESGALSNKDSAAAFRVGEKLGLLGPGAELSGSPPLDPEADRIPVERELEIPIQGMWCASCAWLIERVLLKQRGVFSCLVSFTNDTARVRYSPEYISRQQILDQIRELGYIPGESAGTRTANSAQRDLLVRLGVAAAPAMYMMMFNIILYEGYFSRLEPGTRSFLQELLFFLSLPIVTWCAWPIYRRAWGALRQGVTTMETLVSLGAGSAFAYSVYATVTRQAQVYYDTASMIITLVLLGKYLEAVARSRATSAVGSLSAMLPRKVRLRLADGGEALVAADQVQVGDLVIVDPGATVPVDGVVVDGAGSIDESLLTGEPIPVRREPGDQVVGASLCVEGGIIVRAERTGDSTTISRMANVVKEALASRSTSERLADQISRVFVPLIIIAAVAVFWRDYSTLRRLDDSLMQAISVLVVACPCALGMATPIAVAAAMGSAASRGILIRNSAMLERAKKVDTVVLDKTGTVTAGRLQVVETLTDPDNPPSRSEWEAVASLEALSQHPAARAIVSWLGEQGIAPHPGVEIELIPGKGIRGRAGAHSLLIGASEFAPPLPEAIARRMLAAEVEGKTVVVASSEGSLIGAFVLSDIPRPGSIEAIQAMRNAGIEVWMISGDSETTTAAVARSVGIDHVVSRALPEEKIQRVQEMRAAGRCVAMVGDGVNDGPALAAADLGVAMGAGTQVALEAADMALLAPDLRRLSYAFGLSSRTVRIIRQNLFWALIYNLVSIPAAAGLYGPRLTIGPLFAASAMLVSSLTVVFNSLRLQQRRDEAG